MASAIVRTYGVIAFDWLIDETSRCHFNKCAASVLWQAEVPCRLTSGNQLPSGRDQRLRVSGYGAAEGLSSCGKGRRVNVKPSAPGSG